ncbi:hypothetical protein [Clostridium manihotivorum]|uniref:Uncharacterized protein n=1 Tax=Clostridium manihotivorum TaxID=2320868 RepID=A0A3R5UHG2_9CLOT|nr:hypothetical protein [Clostridium manihotivorum]QAA33810.1 hypothetical protein C1I91_20455 [Clostridium manihotivorum]
MKHNYSLESQITKGVVQYIEDIKIDLNTIKVFLREMNTDNRTSIEVIGFNNFSITLDFPEDIVKDREEFTLQSLIGFTYDEKSEGYIYCLKTDDYEVMFESKNFPTIIKL